MSREAPRWLADFQARFGNAIRTPLDRSSGTLTATPGAYDARLSAETSADRIAVYNRQYWFRLFDVLHSAFPLTARLLGFWEFNEYAGKFFLAKPPRGWDLDDAPNGFEIFFRDTLERENEDEKLALLESIRIDAAWRSVFRAPLTPPFRPSADDAARLLTLQLTPSPSVAFVEDHFALMELRKNVLADFDRAVAFPPRLSQARCWALACTEQGTLQMSLKPREMQLFALLREFPVGEALARLEHACSAEERAELPERTRQWLARSVEQNFWSGVQT
ncbi:MAG: DNA-binding domain-containing protein [Polyangiaceae bacterium]